MLPKMSLNVAYYPNWVISVFRSVLASGTPGGFLMCFQSPFLICKHCLQEVLSRLRTYELR